MYTTSARSIEENQMSIGDLATTTTTAQDDFPSAIYSKSLGDLLLIFMNQKYTRDRRKHEETQFVNIEPKLNR